MHRNTVLKFPGNKIPIIRGNPEAKRKIEELVDDCRQLINPDLGYDEGKELVVTIIHTPYVV